MLKKFHNIKKPIVPQVVCAIRTDIIQKNIELKFFVKFSLKPLLCQISFLKNYFGSIQKFSCSLKTLNIENILEWKDISNIASYLSNSLKFNSNLKNNQTG